MQKKLLVISLLALSGVLNATDKPTSQDQKTNNKKRGLSREDFLQNPYIRMRVEKANQKNRERIEYYRAYHNMMNNTSSQK